MISDVDVVVVGGGPVGVASALLLADRGLSVRVLERETEVYSLPRAVGMDAEIQRVFQNVGLTDELRAMTTPIPGAEFVRPNGERIIGGDIPSHGPFPLGHHPNVMYHQPWLEDMLRAAAVDAGVELMLGVEVTSFVADDTGVVVESTHGSFRGDWLIGADGASSPTRKALGVAFEDQGFDQEWLVFDVRLDREVATLPVNAQQICDAARPVTFVPGHDRFRRWEFQLQPGEDPDEMTRPEKVWQLLDGWMSPDDGELSRAIVYRFHATVADRFRVGRVLLAGDSAHQMPPFLGQGLCSGIRDAANLAWKLELVQRGVADSALLDTYETERRPHAVDMVRHAVDTGRLIDQLAGRVDSGIGLDAGYGGGRAFPFIEAGIVVPGHGAAGKPVPQPVIDGEFFDSRLGDGFSVLVHSLGDVTEVAAEWARLGAPTVEVPPGPLAELVPEGGMVVVRPDRYVAAVVTRDDLAAVTRRLIEALHLS